jgi:hypothetical protein
MGGAKTKYNYIVRMSLLMNLAPEKRKRFRVIEDHIIFTGNPELDNILF